MALDQVRFGHVARKPTWLYLVGVREFGALPPQRKPTHWISGGRSQRKDSRRGLVPVGIKVCSAQQRRRTPVAFAEFLVRLARSAAKERVA